MPCPRCTAYTQYNRRCKNKAACRNGSQRCASHGGSRGRYRISDPRWSISQLANTRSLQGEQSNITTTNITPTNTNNAIPVQAALVHAEQVTAQVKELVFATSEALEHEAGVLDVDHEYIIGVLQNAVAIAEPAMLKIDAILETAQPPAEASARQVTVEQIRNARNNISQVQRAVEDMKEAAIQLHQGNKAKEPKQPKKWNQPLIPEWGTNRDMTVNCSSFGTNVNDTSFNREQECVRHAKCQWNSQRGCHTNVKYSDKALALQAERDKARRRSST